MERIQVVNHICGFTKAAAMEKRLPFYEYTPSRSGKNPKNFLQGFSGFLQTDDYAGYNSVENVTRVGCLAHARRYYTDALKALPTEAKIESTYAYAATQFFKEMFILESKNKDLSPSEKFVFREKELKPVFEAYLSWLQEVQTKVVPKSSLGRAIVFVNRKFPHIITENSSREAKKLLL